MLNIYINNTKLNLDIIKDDKNDISLMDISKSILNNINFNIFSSDILAIKIEKDNEVYEYFTNNFITNIIFENNEFKLCGEYDVFLKDLFNNILNNFNNFYITELDNNISVITKNKELLNSNIYYNYTDRKYRKIILNKIMII